MEKKLAFFEGLKADCERFEQDDQMQNLPVHNPDSTTSVARANWALDMIQKDYADSTKLHAELIQAMNAVSESHYAFSLQSVTPKGPIYTSR